MNYSKPVDMLSRDEQQALLESLRWLLSYCDSEKVARLVREDAVRRLDHDLKKYPKEFWVTLTEITLENTMYPIAEQLRESLE